MIATTEDTHTSAARGAAEVRLTLARMYGRTTVATAIHWAIVPCLTETGEIGVVDVARGTAWASGVAASDDVYALGVDDVITPSGNHPSLGGDVYIDGERVQRDGMNPGAPITAPSGWRRILLPTWMGYYGDGHAVAPRELWEPREHWIKPRLQAVGLVTCYGTPGRPRRTLEDSIGLDRVRPWQHPSTEDIDPQWWPMSSDEHVAVIAAGTAVLDKIIERLFSLLGALAEGDARGVWDSARRPSDTIAALREPGYRPLWSVSLGAQSPVGRALSQSGITHVADLAEDLRGPQVVVGARRYDLIVRLVERLLGARLQAVAEAITALYGDDRQACDAHLDETVERAATWLLRDCAGIAHSAGQRVVDAYYAAHGGPVFVDMAAHEEGM